MAEVPSSLACGICTQLCKRGAKLLCCGAIACRACATKTITRDKKCWLCGKEALSKDLVNDDELRGMVDKFQKGEWTEPKKTEVKKPEVKTPEVKKPEVKKVEVKKPEVKKPEVKKPEVKKPEPQLMKPPAAVPAVKKTETAEDVMKARAAKNIAEKRKTETASAGSPKVKKANMAEVSLQMMKERNTEFEMKMNPVEKASKELRFGAQLELMFTFNESDASCRMCGEQFTTEKLTQTHLQQSHKDQYQNLKAVLSPPDNNMLQLCLQKALKSEFLFAREQTFPVAVNY